MKKILIAAAAFAMLFTGCNSENENKNSSAAVSSEISTETAAETPVQTTSETAEETIFSETVTVLQTEITTSAATETETEIFSETEIPKETVLPDKNDINGFEIYYNSDEIPDRCAERTAEYFQAMQNIDTEKYDSMLIPLYRDYLHEYLEESDYTVKKLLEGYYNSIKEQTGGDFRYSKAELKRLYDKDYIEYNIENYPHEYMKQLDEISYEKDGTYISETFDEYFGILCDIYAESGGNEYKIIDSGVVTVFRAGDEYYILIS